MTSKFGHLWASQSFPHVLSTKVELYLLIRFPLSIPSIPHKAGSHLPSSVCFNFMPFVSLTTWPYLIPCAPEKLYLSKRWKNIITILLESMGRGHTLLILWGAGTSLQLGEAVDRKKTKSAPLTSEDQVFTIICAMPPTSLALSPSSPHLALTANPTFRGPFPLIPQTS